MPDEAPIEEVSLEDLERAKQALLKRTIKGINSLKPSEQLRTSWSFWTTSLLAAGLRTRRRASFQRASHIAGPRR